MFSVKRLPAPIERAGHGRGPPLNAAGLCASFVALDPSELFQADLDGSIGFVRARDLHGGAIEYLLFAPCLVLCELVWVLVPMNPFS